MYAEVSNALPPREKHLTCKHRELLRNVQLIDDLEEKNYTDLKKAAEDGHLKNSKKSLS